MMTMPSTSYSTVNHKHTKYLKEKSPTHQQSMSKGNSRTFWSAFLISLTRSGFLKGEKNRVLGNSSQSSHIRRALPSFAMGCAGSTCFKTRVTPQEQNVSLTVAARLRRVTCHRCLLLCLLLPHQAAFPAGETTKPECPQRRGSARLYASGFSCRC